MLLAINEELPKEIYAHGFFTVDGQKMSKTIGNVIKPEVLVDKYGVDGSRYVLMASFPFGEDGDFSWEYFNRLYTSDLSNGLGNLVSRIAKLAENNQVSLEDPELKFDPEVEKLLSEYKFSEALKWIWSEITEIDRRVNEEKPWELEGDEAKEVITNLAKLVSYIAFNLQPFLPETSEKILSQFKGSIKSSTPLFPRI